MLRLTPPRREVRQVSQVVTITLRFGVCSWALLLGMQSSPFFYFLLQNHNGNTCQENNTISLLEECGIFLSSVSSQQKFEVTDQHYSPRTDPVTALKQTGSQLSDRSVLQLHVTAQFYLENKGKYILHAWGHADPKDAKRRGELPPALWLLFLCGFYLLPLGLPYVNWASQECCLFYLRSSLWSSDLPLFYFLRLFPSLSFSHCHSGLLFPILTSHNYGQGYRIGVNVWTIDS